MKPLNMDGGSVDNVLINSAREFSQLCVALMRNGISAPEKLSIFKFFSAVTFYEKRKPQAQ